MALSGLQADSSLASLWQEHRETFRQLYLVEGKTLSQVQEIMESQYSFAKFPLSIYETRLRDQLGLRKKLKNQDWIAIDQHLTKHGNRQSEVHLNGALVSRKKLKKEIRRDWQRNTGIQVPRDLPLPPGISITTPRQSPCDDTFGNNARTAEGGPSTTQRLDERSSSSSSITRRASNMSVTTAPISNIDGANLSVSRSSQYQSLFNNMKGILASRSTWFPLTSVDSIILDERFVKLWPSCLNKLPTLQLQATMLERLTDKSIFVQSLWSGSTVNSLGDYSMSELESIDAAKLGLSYAVPTEDIVECESDYQVSLNIDLLYAFNTLMYYLANDLGHIEDIYEILHRVAHQLPWHLLEAFLRLDLPTVQESWSTLLNWAYKISSRSFFESLMQILLKQPQLTEWYGIRALIMAAWFDCYDICSLLIHHGVSPNKMYEIEFRDKDVFPESLKALPMYKEKRFLPLTVAALGGNYRSVKALLDGGADVSLRYDGYTAASRLLFSLEKDNLNRDNRLKVMELFLESGLDVNEPVRDVLSSGKPYCSDETLLDMAYLMGDSELTKLLQVLDQTPESQLTISGIISHAEKGLQALQAYLHVAHFPRGLRRQRMKYRALYQSTTKPRAVITMVQANFYSQLPFEMEGMIPGRQTSVHIRSTTDILKRCFIKISDHIPLKLLSRDQISYLWRQDSNTKNSLISACLRNRRGDGLLHLLDNGLCLTEDEGVVMMAEAARQNHFAAVSVLLYHNININGTLRVKETDFSVFSLAISLNRIPNELHLLRGDHYASLEMLQFLVRYGAEMNTSFPSFWKSPSQCVNPYVLQWLISNGLNLTGQSICNIMMRILDCHHSLEILQRLINLGLPIFSPNELMRNRRYFPMAEHPLSFFISLKPGQEFVSRVLNSGIDVNDLRMSSKTTPLQAAINASDLGLVKELICRGAVINETGGGSYTPLELVCGASTSTIDDPVRLSIAEHLLKHGADPNHTKSTRDNARSALEFALLSPASGVRLIELLLRHGANVNAHLRERPLIERSWHQTFILHIALTKSHFSVPDKRRVVEMLLDGGARVHARDEHNWGPSALEEMCRHEGPDQIYLVDLLLNRGVESNAKYIWSSSALEIACNHNNLELINLFLDRRLDPDSADALVMACEAQNIDLIKLLLDRGADPNPRKQVSCGPLAIAAAKGALPIALLLLAAGAKVTVPTKYWEDCPLVAAAAHKRLDMVALLLNFETRREAFDKAASAAKNKGYFAIASLIQKHLGRTSPLPPQGQVEEVGEPRPRGLSHQELKLPSSTPSTI